MPGSVAETVCDVLRPGFARRPGILGAFAAISAQYRYHAGTAVNAAQGTIGVMNTASFLDTAETRATHLRELSNSLRALGWTNAVRRDIDHEIPEIEVAMAVYRRLSAEGYKPDDALGAWEFLADADSRADHLRQASHHMHSLDWVHASLIEVEHEIPDLEMAMVVYRRLSAEANERNEGSAAKSPAASAAAVPVSVAVPVFPLPMQVGPPSPASDAETESVPSSSFRQFVMNQSDADAVETADEERPLETASSANVKGTL